MNAKKSIKLKPNKKDGSQKRTLSLKDTSSKNRMTGSKLATKKKKKAGGGGTPDRRQNKEVKVAGKSPPCRPLEEEGFYHGLLPRADANLLLGKQGDFIVRLTQKRENDPKELAISVMWDSTVQHILPAKTPNGTFLLDKIEFNSVAELVRYHHTKKVPLYRDKQWQLLTPIMRQDWELGKSQVVTESQLGRGAFGEVWKGTLALSFCPPITVAVKICHTNSMSKAQLQDFMNEARLMRQYDHPNVVRFYGVVTEEPVMIVMEFVCGGSLDKHLKKNVNDTAPKENRQQEVVLQPELPQQRLLSYCVDAAKGMEYLHSKRCMHRDVAARNCLIGEDIVKISDFGLCREEGKYKMDLSKKVPIRWLSPETLIKAVYTYKSDVFSFGVLMWEVYSLAQQPYPNMSTLEVQQKLRVGYRMEPPSRMPDAVRDLLTQCWLEDPAARPDFISLANRLASVAHNQFQSSAEDPNS